MKIEDSSKLREENFALKRRVHELELLLENLTLEVRSLKLSRAREAEPENPEQYFLEITQTESVTLVDDDQGAEASEEKTEDQDEEPEPTIPSSTTKRKRKIRLSPEEKLKNLPVSEEIVHIPDEVKADPDAWEEIPGIVREEVLVHPTHLSRRRIVLKKFVKRGATRTEAPIIAKAPISFSSSYVSESLAIYIVLNKYLEHGTLHRLESKFARLGVDISKQVQSDVVERFSEWLRPLYELIDKIIKTEEYLQIDETFIKYINGENPGSGQGYFWATLSPGRYMLFKWHTNRRHENVAPLLEGFNGILQSDGYAAYSNYAETHPEVTLLACWSHTFRKFRDAQEAEPKHAKSMMKLISDLYALEETWDKEGITDSARLIERSKQSMPIVEQIKAKLDTYAVDMTIPKNKFREAVGYTAGQWNALVECFKYGHTRLDTNLLESKFRPTKIGAKNWTFIGHPDAGEKSAIIYTLINCCRINKINPQAYFTDVLAKLIPHDQDPPEELLEALLPNNWIKANPEHFFKEPRAA